MVGPLTVNEWLQHITWCIVRGLARVHYIIYKGQKEKNRSFFVQSMKQK